MTHEELDAMWSIATGKSIEQNQPYTRYEFAAMVREASHKELIAECEDLRQKYFNLCDIQASSLRTAHQLGDSKAMNAVIEFKNRIADEIEAMPFGDTAASFAVWIREQS